MVSVGKSTWWSRTSSHERPLGDGVVLGAVGAPDRRADGRLVARPDHDRAGTVAEDERRRPVVGVGEVRELLAADDQHVLGAATAHHVVGQRDAVAEAGAGGGQVDRGGAGCCAPRPGVGDRRGGRRGLQRVGDGREDDRADLLRDGCPPGRSPCRRPRRLMSMTVSSGPAQRRDSMPERSRIHSSEESMRSQISALVTTPGRAVAAHAEDPRVARRRWRVVMAALLISASPRSPRGAAGSTAGRETTGSPSSTSHSTTVPPWGATTGCSSARGPGCRRRCPGSSTVPSGRSTMRIVPLAGATSIRQVGEPSCGAALPWRAARSRAASRSSGVLRATVSTPGSERLTRPVERAGRRHLDHAGDAELAHRLHAQVPAHRVAHLADDPGAARRGPGRRRRRRGWR